MPIESWTMPEDAPDLAAHAKAMIDAALVGTPLAQEAYWAAVRKSYNTPYNDPPRDAVAKGEAAAASPSPAPTVPDTMRMPLAVMAAMAAEARAA